MVCVWVRVAFKLNSVIQWGFSHLASHSGIIKQLCRSTFSSTLKLSTIQIHWEMITSVSQSEVEPITQHDSDSDHNILTSLGQIPMVHPNCHVNSSPVIIHSAVIRVTSMNPMLCLRDCWLQENDWTHGSQDTQHTIHRILEKSPMIWITYFSRLIKGGWVTPKL